jgi:hypothetical protein
MSTARRAGAAGPLVVSAANPRYFAVASDGDDGKVVYLTGSHIWNNFHDGLGPGAACAETPERNDYRAYLEFLKDHGHNFIRLWRWEHVRSQAAAGNFHLCMTPQPWSRTGPGLASDGKPRFDLSSFDPAYFDRLRDRVASAGEVGIYVSVMLFDGWALHLSPPPDNLEGHPFHAANNVNQIGIGSILDYQVLPLDPEVRALQEAYIRKVVDTVHDLPNVLYEVANESSGADAPSVELPDGSTIPTPVGDSTRWQYWVIDYLKRYEREQGYDRHPVGMTMQFPVADQRKANEPLFDSPADWVSPGFDEEIVLAPDGGGPAPARWYTDPPASDGTKVVIADTDHFAPGMGDALWAWKAFLRGHHPILMDFGLIGGVQSAGGSPADTGEPPFEAYEAARWAMGDTRRYAERINLIGTRPRADIASTGYALVHPGSEYLVLEPYGDGRAFTVDLSAGSYAVEWFDVATRETSVTGSRAVDQAGPAEFSAPFRSGPAVLYLSRTGS